jgi:hypothetical protein
MIRLLMWIVPSRSREFSETNEAIDLDASRYTTSDFCVSYLSAAATELHLLKVALHISAGFASGASAAEMVCLHLPNVGVIFPFPRSAFNTVHSMLLAPISHWLLWKDFKLKKRGVYLTKLSLVLH